MVLPEYEKELVKKHLSAMTGEVELIVFTQEKECQFCRETRELMLELGTLSPKIKTTVYDLVKDEEMAKKYDIKKIPATAIVGREDYGIRYYGVPAGYEFPVLLGGITDVSKGPSSLQENIKKKLSEIKKPVHIQVFVSPTCPYCPAAAKTAYQFAIENEFIKSDVIEMTEFPHLVQRYSIMSTPHIVINEDTSFAGAQPAEIFIELINMALRQSYNPMYS
ncbi:MAG TPA: thioredoxin family protein [Candidatus Methanoperedens sp.]|nr:thioredoxin family protein [Candidatus Methanoperedens sp.]HLB70359.1 thioredoxin family protein [Candidatus Methanoperedens sp.]